jgi:Flp pilus assembly protein TadG
MSSKVIFILAERIKDPYNRLQAVKDFHLGITRMFPLLKHIQKPAGLVANHARRQNQRGSVMLEAGLALPVLILMACGAMDFARVFVAGIVVESAARAGGQFGSLNVGKTDETAINEAGINDASNQGLTGVAVTSRTFCGCVSGTSEVSCSTGTCSGGELPSGYVETTATYAFRPMVNYPGIPQSIPLSSTTRFRVQ